MYQSEPNFYIAALPRSRTAWLSAWLCNGTSFCFHEILHRNEGVFPVRPELYVGTAETRLELIPEGCPRVIVHRPVMECYDSLMTNFEVPEGVSFTAYSKLALRVLKDYNNKLDDMTGLHIAFDDIDDSLWKIHRYLMPNEPIDQDRIDEMQRLNIQITTASVGDL